VRTVDLAGETRTAMLTTSPVTVNLVLKELLDDLADTAPPAEQTADYRKGFSAGIRFVRICVLDEIAAVSGGLARVPMAARTAAHPHRPADDTAPGRGAGHPGRRRQRRRVPGRRRRCAGDDLPPDEAGGGE
jgi:hypothetical protein